MEINHNIIQNLGFGNIKTEPAKNVPLKNTLNPQDGDISSVNTVGQSLINTNVPVSYTKIAEIPVAGLKEKASLYRLSNGQRVAILPKKGPTYIRTSFNVGSLNEEDSQRGISHFIEHNLFNGSKDLPSGEYDKKLTELGGSTNAFTNFAETQYHLNLQLLDDKSLEEAIKLNAALTQNPTFPTDQLEKEKEPVKQEIDMVSDDPVNKTFSVMVKNLFSIQSSSDNIVIGRKDNINKLTRQDVLDYYNTWYTPDNAITVITGDVDTDEAIRLAAKYYNKKPDTTKISKRKYQPLTSQDKPVRCDIKQNSSPNTIIALGFPIPANTSVREIEKIRLMLYMLTSQDSYLTQNLDKLGTDISFDIETLSSDPNAPKVINSCISIPEEHSEEVIKTIYDGIVRLMNTPPDTNSFNTTVSNAVHELNNSAEHSENISSSLVSIIRDNDFNYYENYKNNILSLTPYDISLLAQKYLDLNKISICVSHPESVSDNEIMNNYVNANKGSKSISFGKSYNPKNVISEEINKLKEFHLQNNMEAAIMPVDNQSDASLYLNIETDPDDNISKAAAKVLTEILNRGSVYKDNITYSRFKKENNASIGFAASGNSINVYASFAPERINEITSLIKETLMSPNFTQAEFDRAKKIIKDELSYEKANPSDLLGTFLNPESKYYANKQAQLDALEKLTINDLMQLYNRILYNAQANIALAAPVNNDANIEQIFLNNFSQGFPFFRPFIKSRYDNIPKYRPNTQEKIITAAENNSQASIIQSYQYKYTGNLEDKVKIEMLNMILGSSGLSSRLFNDLRNNEKLAYTVGSDTKYTYDRGEIQLFIETSTDPDITPEASPENVNRALAGFKRNVNKLKTEYVSEQELKSVKTIYKTILLNSFESNDNKADIADQSVYNIYGKDYYLKLLDIIDNITPSDIMAAANYVFKDPPVTAVVASKNTLDYLKLQ